MQLDSIVVRILKILQELCHTNTHFNTIKMQRWFWTLINPQKWCPLADLCNLFFGVINDKTDRTINIQRNNGNYINIGYSQHRQHVVRLTYTLINARLIYALINAISSWSAHVSAANTSGQKASYSRETIDREYLGTCTRKNTSCTRSIERNI